MPSTDAPDVSPLIEARSPSVPPDRLATYRPSGGAHEDRRVPGVHRAAGLAGPGRRYAVIVLLLAGLTSLPTLAAISAGSATIGDVSAGAGGTTPFMAQPTEPPAVIVPPLKPPVGEAPLIPPRGQRADGSQHHAAPAATRPAPPVADLPPRRVTESGSAGEDGRGSGGSGSGGSGSGGSGCGGDRPPPRPPKPPKPPKPPFIPKPPRHPHMPHIPLPKPPRPVPPRVPRPPRPRHHDAGWSPWHQFRPKHAHRHLPGNGHR
jgi:hypothetical protein